MDAQEIMRELLRQLIGRRVRAESSSSEGEEEGRRKPVPVRNYELKWANDLVSKGGGWHL